MSETVSPPSAEPGAAAVSPWPNVTEAAEPGGVNWTMRRPLQRGDVLVEPPAQALVELLGSVDVGHGDDVDLEVHVDHVCLLERFLQLAGDLADGGLDTTLHDLGRTCQRLVQSFSDGWLANRDEPGLSSGPLM